MLAVILLSSGILAFAATYELFALHYQPAALVAAFWSLPIPQRVAWLAIGLAPICLMLFTLVQHCMLVAKRKAAEALQARLQGIHLDVSRSEQDQKGIEQAAAYLGRSEPERALDVVRARLVNTEQTIEYHQQRNQSGDITGSLEQVRQQQLEVRLKLGEAIAKRRSIERSISQLQSYQEEMEQCISLIEQDSEGEPLERRLQKLTNFIGAANSRCEEIERAKTPLRELEEKFEALQRRLWPLEQKEAGVNGVLNALFDARNRLTTSLARLEQDEGVSLGDRIQELAKTKHDIEERVSSVLAQFSEIDTIHQGINGLFLRLNQAHRIPRELDPAGRVVPLNG